MFTFLVNNKLYLTDYLAQFTNYLIPQSPNSQITY